MNYQHRGLGAGPHPTLAVGVRSLGQPGQPWGTVTLTLSLANSGGEVLEDIVHRITPWDVRVRKAQLSTEHRLREETPPVQQGGTEVGRSR